MSAVRLLETIGFGAQLGRDTLYKRATSVVHLTNFSFELFYAVFAEDASLLFLYHVAKKSKWPKTQIKWFLPLNLVHHPAYQWQKTCQHRSVYAVVLLLKCVQVCVCVWGGGVSCVYVCERVCGLMSRSSWLQLHIVQSEKILDPGTLTWRVPTYECNGVCMLFRGTSTLVRVGHTFGSMRAWQPKCGCTCSETALLLAKTFI